jgi:hypothetical protein
VQEQITRLMRSRQRGRHGGWSRNLAHRPLLSTFKFLWRIEKFSWRSVRGAGKKEKRKEDLKTAVNTQPHLKNNQWPLSLLRSGT